MKTWASGVPGARGDSQSQPLGGGPLRGLSAGLLIGVLGMGGVQQALAQSGTNCVPFPPGLVSFWMGDGTPGDLTAMNNGTVVGEVAFVAGEVGQAFSFDGVSGYISIPDSPSLDPVGPFSVELWVNASPSQPYSRFPLVNKSYQTTNDAGWVLRGNFDGTISFLFGIGVPYTNSTFVSTTTNVTDGLWHHLAGVFTGTQLQIYLVTYSIHLEVPGTLHPARTVNGS